MEEEAEADRGRVLFSAPFRRLQNKAQVFSLETNAAVRSRLTHSLEVSSIGRFVAQQTLKAFAPEDLEGLGIAGNERALITFVETACLLHDIGNPPFGHFGEIAISDWFHQHSASLKPNGIGGPTLRLWERHFADFQNFDGNPQGFRVCTRLQPTETKDLTGFNLTATTLATIIKYPWNCEKVGELLKDRPEVRKKGGYFRTEDNVIEWIRERLGLTREARHPLVYLMEAADDIAYCVSDIEDGIEKGLISARSFAEFMLETLNDWRITQTSVDKDARAIIEALELLRVSHSIEHAVPARLTLMQDFRSGITRFLSRHAGVAYRQSHDRILAGMAPALLREGEAAKLLNGLKAFASALLYSSSIVRSRELTAQAVLTGLLDAYLPLMNCERQRFESATKGEHQDDQGRSIARECSLVSRIPLKHFAVYIESVSRIDRDRNTDHGAVTVLERVYRMRLMLDHISGMTDEFAFQSFQLIGGVRIHP